MTKAAHKQQVLVSERAVVARLRRRLAREGEILRRCRRDSQWYRELGDWYVVDGSLNYITSKFVDLESYARECGVLEPWERLAGE
jgi:hypothetical protein